MFTAGGVDHPGSIADTLIFPGGTFKVAPSAGTGTQILNPKTCLLNINMKGTYKIYGGSGTYTGISGHGTDQLSTLGIAARFAGKCTQKGPPVTHQQIVQGSGPVHPPRHTVQVLPGVPATSAAQARHVPHPDP